MTVKPGAEGCVGDRKGVTGTMQAVYRWQSLLW